MTVAKIGQKQVAQVIETLLWTLSGDDGEAAAETRRRARLTGPDCIAFLHYVLRTDKFASPTQRVRGANMLLEAGEYLAATAKETGLTRETEEADSANEHEAS